MEFTLCIPFKVLSLYLKGKWVLVNANRGWVGKAILFIYVFWFNFILGLNSISLCSQ